MLVSGLVGSSSKTNIKDVYDLANSKLNVGFDDVPYMKGFLTVCHLTHLIRWFFISSLLQIFFSHCRQRPNLNFVILSRRNWMAAAKVKSRRHWWALVMASVAYNREVLPFIVKHPLLIRRSERHFNSMKFATSTKCHSEKIQKIKELSYAKDRHFWIWYPRDFFGCAKLVCCRSMNDIGWPKNLHAYQMFFSPVSASIIWRLFSFSSVFRTLLCWSFCFWKMSSTIFTRKTSDVAVEIVMVVGARWYNLYLLPLCLLRNKFSILILSIACEHFCLNCFFLVILFTINNHVGHRSEPRDNNAELNVFAFDRTLLTFYYIICIFPVDPVAKAHLSAYTQSSVSKC